MKKPTPAKYFIFGMLGCFTTLLLEWLFFAMLGVYHHRVILKLDPGDIIQTPERETYVVRHGVEFTAEQTWMREEKLDGTGATKKEECFIGLVQVTRLNSLFDTSDDKAGYACYGVKTKDIEIALPVGSKWMGYLYAGSE
jgi:hypothetical protein